MLIQISWLLKKPTDLDLHSLPLTVWAYINNLDLVIWLTENLKGTWHLNLFSMTRIKLFSFLCACTLLSKVMSFSIYCFCALSLSLSLSLCVYSFILCIQYSNCLRKMVLCTRYTQQAHNVKMTSFQRRCDVITSHRRWYDVILTLCALWVCTRTFKIIFLHLKYNLLLPELCLLSNFKQYFSYYTLVTSFVKSWRDTFIFYSYF